MNRLLKTPRKQHFPTKAHLNQAARRPQAEFAHRQSTHLHLRQGQWVEPPTIVATIKSHLRLSRRQICRRQRWATEQTTVRRGGHKRRDSVVTAPRI